jgi:Ser/Thr protein kinase RdoA (MazF antagonist)
MPPYNQLTVRGQGIRLRRLGQAALTRWGLAHAVLTLIQHAENTTFRVYSEAARADSLEAGPYLPGHYLLRIHGPGRHGADLASQNAIRSELQWLDALRQDCGIAVPAPVVTLDGKSVVVADAPGAPQARVCSLLRWLPGQRRTASPPPRLFFRLGQLMAVMHEHARNWLPPPEFRRMRWDWNAFFGDTVGFAGLSASETWALVPPATNDLLAAVGERAAMVMRDLGESDTVWGLIHADLHLDNVLLYRSETRPIDFDDCGYGYWLYDIAVALWEQRMTPSYPAIHQAFLDGYASRRPTPDEQLIFLDLFIAMREAAFGLWHTAMAQHNLDFRTAQAEELERIRKNIHYLLPDL